MNVTWHEQKLTVDDGRAARCGIGVLVPAILVSALFVVLMPSADGHARLGAAVLMFLAAALALAILRAPRKSEFDPNDREVRLTIGWPPYLGREATVPFSDIIDTRLWQPIRFSDDWGAARPALILRSGKTLFLSTYNRSPRFCRGVVAQVRQALGMTAKAAKT